MQFEAFKIENEQVVLNILNENDAEDLYQALIHSLLVFRKFPASMPWVMQEPSLDSSKAFCRSRVLALLNKENFVYSIRDAKTQAFIGVIDIHKIDWVNNTAAVGFWANVAYHSQGYMTEALRLFVAELIDNKGFKQLDAFVDTENVKARKLCLRANFYLSEIEYQSAQNPVDGSMRDICLYKLESKA